MEYDRTDRIESRRPDRGRLIKPLAAGALALSLAACSSPDRSAPLPAGDRNAPMSAPYSLDVDPQYYDDLAKAERYAVDKPALDRLRHQPVAEWLPAGAAASALRIRDDLDRAKTDGTIPLFVSYAIPGRDNGGQSAGGLSADEYRSYIGTVSREIGQSPAIVVVEPDALAGLPDLDGDVRDERIGLLADALDAFHADAHTAVYLDAGNSAWRSAGETAGLLKEVAARTRYGIHGISLNVSNFRSDAETTQYLNDVEDAYGKRLYALIDSSRNGDPRAASFTGQDPWCNPPDERLGSADAVFDARAAVERAFVKTPGESDGQCNLSQQPAGVFDGALLNEQLK